MNTAKKSSLAYLTALVGIIISFTLWHLIKTNTLDLYVAWIILGMGIALSFLLAVLIHTIQLGSHRAVSSAQISKDLKKETAARTHAEEGRQRLEVALLQGQKLQAIGTLAGGIAHDFNNILYAVKGYTEMSREDVPQDSVTYKNLGKVLEAIARGQELVARILTFSRRQHHDFSAMDMDTTIEAALALLRPTIPAGVIIDYQVKAHSTILGNQTLLHQILVNVINNAVDAMDEQGTITLTLTRVVAGDPELERFPQLSRQNYCKIEIKDTGHGMDQQTAERMFEPFFTTKEVGKGTGLGLSIVHSIMQEHQGGIAVTSKLGRGTILTLLFPEQQGENHGKNSASRR